MPQYLFYSVSRVVATQDYKLNIFYYTVVIIESERQGFRLMGLGLNLTKEIL